MKIVHVINSLRQAGAETLVKDYFLNFSEKNDYILIVTGKKENTFNFRCLREKGVEVFFLGESKVILNRPVCFLGKLWNYFWKKIFFISLIKKIQPNIVHGHLMSVYLLNAIKNKKITKVYTVHNVLSHYLQNKKLKHDLFCFAKQSNNYFIALTHEMKNDILSRFGNVNVFVVNNAIDFKRFDPHKFKKSLIRQKFSFTDNQLIIGNIGRFEEQKNQMFLISVFKKIPVKDKKLILVGTGSLRNVLQEEVVKNKIENDVIFLENRSDIPEILAMLDVFAFPSVFEGFGIVILEAEAMEIPCVISDKCSSEVIIRSDVNQIPLVEEIWVDKILNSSKGKFLPNKTKFDIKVIVDILEKIYEEIYK